MPDNSVKDLVAKLESGVKDLFESDKYREYLQTMSRFPTYSTRNTMLIHLQYPNATRVGGFGFWRDKMNRRVNKGEHGIKIFAPIANKGRDIEVEKLDPVTKMPILDENGQPIMERLSPTSNLQVRFKIVTVFDVAQTSGEPLPELIETLDGDVERYELFMDALRAVSPLPIAFAPLDADMDGRCIFGNKIEIREGMSEVQTVAAVVHEIVHAKYHDTTIIRDGDEPQNRREQEVTAESISFVVNSHFGVDTGANSFGYVATWVKGKEAKELNTSLDTIRKASAALINEIGEKYQELAKERGVDLTAKAEKATDEPETPDINEPLRKEAQNAVEYTAFQKKGFAIAQSYAHLPLQVRIDIIAQAFNCKTASVETSPCTGKWRGTSDICVRLDNGAALFIGNRRTPEAKKTSVIGDCVNKALSGYNPQTVSEAKRNAYVALLEQERKDNEIAEQRGLKPYKVLTVEMNDGHDSKTGGYLGWYFVTLEVGGKIFGHLTSNLNSDISRGTVGEDYGKRGYFVAGGLHDIDVDYVFANVGHSTLDTAYKMELTSDVLERAKEALARRGNFESALDGMKSVEETSAITAEINELLNGGKSAEPPELPKTIELSLPDPTWTVAELAEYGYTEPDMFPLSVGRAVELFDTGHTIYLLYPNNTEAVAFDRDEIMTFSSDGFCGITKTDWEMSPVRDAQNKVYENIIINREQVENSKESQLIHSGESMFGIYQIRDDIDEARNFRFAPMRELDSRGLTVDRDNYELVYTGELPIRDTQTNLHRLFREFQHDSPECPADFTFPSVSVSDVIVLQQGGEVSAHFVDSAGFKELPSFTGNEREQTALYQTPTPQSLADFVGTQVDTTSQLAMESAKSESAAKSAPQKPAQKAAPRLLDQLAEAKQLVARGSQPTAKQNEREV